MTTSNGSGASRKGGNTKRSSMAQGRLQNDYEKMNQLYHDGRGSCSDLDSIGGQLSFFTPETDAEDNQWGYATRDDDAWQSDKMSPKVPPAYNGNTSFFAYEENVIEWLSICTVEEH